LGFFLPQGRSTFPFSRFIPPLRLLLFPTSKENSFPNFTASTRKRDEIRFGGPSFVVPSFLTFAKAWSRPPPRPSPPQFQKRSWLPVFFLPKLESFFGRAPFLSGGSVAVSSSTLKAMKGRVKGPVRSNLSQTFRTALTLHRNRLLPSDSPYLPRTGPPPFDSGCSV